MEEIVERLLENLRVDEMALSRSDAIDRCISLGKQFIEHFHKVCLEGVSGEDFSHHCQEMQSWFDSVNRIKLKGSNSQLTNTQLLDWFFTVGANVEDFLEEDTEVSLYNEFIIKFLSDRSQKVVSLMKDILSSKKDVFIMKEIVERLQETRQIELAKEILESKGYIVEKRNLDVDEDGSILRSEIQSRLDKVLTKPEYGFDKDEVKDYSAVDVYTSDGYLVVEVRAEVSYDGLMDLCDELNPIVRHYDKDAYFEPVSSGIITAYLPV